VTVGKVIRGGVWRNNGGARGGRFADITQFKARALGFRCVRLMWLRYIVTEKGMLSERTVTARTLGKHFRDQRVNEAAVSARVLQGFRCIRRETT
jgi:hypothetical protein